MKEKQIKNKTEMNCAQEELCKRLELVGFDVDRDTCRAVRKLFPQSISARSISLELDELFGKLSDSADIDAVWEVLGPIIDAFGHIAKGTRNEHTTTNN